MVLNQRCTLSGFVPGFQIVLQNLKRTYVDTVEAIAVPGRKKFSVL